MRFTLIILLHFIVLLAMVKCDLPSHCLVSDVEGQWVFYLSKSSFSPSLKNHQTTCGHGFPNRISKEIGDKAHSPFDQARQLSFTLGKDYKVYQNGVQVGTWTPVYDQSFIINYHQSIITASYKYYLSEKDNTKYESNCGKTMLGWVIADRNNLQRGWSCLYGVKAERLALFKKSSFIQKERKERGNKDLLYQVKSEDLKGMVKEINASGLPWKAKLYEEYKGLTLIELRERLGLNTGKARMPLRSPEVIAMKRRQLNAKKAMSMIDIQTSDSSREGFVYTYEDFKKRMKEPGETIAVPPSNQFKASDYSSALERPIEASTNSSKEKDSIYVTDLNEVKKYLNSSIDDMNEQVLPDNWDWRNVGGINYVTPVEDQGNCGSCYVFSTIYSLESRLRIQTDNKDKTRFSIQFPISCNFYSEGCNGGFPLLVAKFFSEFELIPRECFPYTQSNNKCSNACDYTQFPKKYTVDRYGYLGGFYCGTSEAMMMKEIRARGPIPGSIKVPVPFNFYSSGIFSMKELKSNSQGLNKTRMVDRNLSFETVEHSITLVGYGVENGVKYWIGKNTWGDFWGEKGYFRILRGENEQSIESMGDYFTIKVTDRY